MVLIEYMKETFCKICGAVTKFGGQTCSRVHADELKKINSRETRQCKMCNKDFVVKKTSETKLCSDECRKFWALIPENKEKRIKASYESNLKNHGGLFSTQTEECIKNTKAIKKERYGNENYNNLEKCKKTKEERYGDENYNNMPKNKETKKENYGDENYNNREKAKETMIDLYGVEYSLQLEEFQNKRIETNKKTYGVEHPLQNEEVRKKSRQTSLERYGEEYPMRCEFVKDKIREHYYNSFDETKMFSLLEENKIKILDEYKGIQAGGRYKYYKFKCKVCEFEFTASFSRGGLIICRNCNPITTCNSIHLEIRNFLRDNELMFDENVRYIISPQEIDFYIESHNLAIELDGNYWHSELGGGKTKYYHINKTKDCFKKDIKLIHIFEDEWLFKKEIIKSRILNILNKTKNKIFARKCLIKEINSKDKKEFLINNHLMGDSKDNIRLGLFYENKLCSVMTFSKRRIAPGGNSKDIDSWELNRFTFLINTSVVGGFQRLLNHFIKQYKPKNIITYADIKWSGTDYKNTVYYKNGFEFIKQVQPSYWYFTEKEGYLKKYHRFNFNKSKMLKLTGEPKDTPLTEWDMAKNLKMDRIWDCGVLSFIKNI